MHPVLRSFLWLAFFGSVAHAAPGIIYFNRIPTPDSAAALFRANADGSGEEAIPMALPEAYAPAVSRDGRRLLVTSGDPGRPFKISDNVYALDLVTGGLAPVTAFEDVVSRGGVFYTNDLGRIVATDNISGYTISFPSRKTLSPDGTVALTINMLMSGSVTAGSFNVPIPSSLYTSRLQTATLRAPFSELYPIGAAPPIGRGVFYGSQRTAFNQGGDGVDWHPARAEIVLCMAADIPATGNSGLTIAEGTLLGVFAIDGVNNPFVRKLTAPAAVWNGYVDLVTNFSQVQTQHDSVPAISPDGSRVAYVRHTQRTDTRIQLPPLPALVEIRSIGYDGRDDRLVLSMVEGAWITQLTWSPDGTEIAFDLAPQVIIDGFPGMLGDPTRSEIYAVGADGSNPRRVIAGPASFPAWGPGQLQTPVRSLAVQLTRSPDGTIRLRPAGDPPPDQVQVETSTDLINWATAGQLGPGMEWIATPDQEARFFRFLGPVR